VVKRRTDWPGKGWFVCDSREAGGRLREMMVGGQFGESGARVLLKSVWRAPRCR
jgi:hypothetical protein